MKNNKIILCIFYCLLVILVPALYYLSLKQYLVFHSFAEIFSIIIAGCIFIIAWNGSKIVYNGFIVVLGSAFLFVGIIDLLHLIAYRGMGIIDHGESNTATQLWIAGSYLKVTAFLAVPFSLKIQKMARWFTLLFLIYTVLILLSIFYWGNFPDCYLEETGLTTFKKASEIIFIFLFLISLTLLWKYDRFIEPYIKKNISYSIIFSMTSELFFILYTDVYGIYNFTGHILKIIAYYFTYKAIVETVFIRPYDLIFKELKQSEESLKQSEKRFRSLHRTSSRVLSIIGHDLRSPVISMVMHMKLLLDPDNNISKDQMERFADDFKRTSDNTLALLDNLLFWGMDQTGDLVFDPVPCSCSSLIQSALEPLHQQAKMKNISLDIDSDKGLTCTVDQNMITTVIRNLVANAIKFSPEDSTIFISAHAGENTVEFCVKDSGPGISPQEVNALVDGGNEHKEKQKKKKGTGLGFILCRDFVKRHDGSIRIESDNGHGTSVFFTIPVH